MLALATTDDIPNIAYLIQELHSESPVSEMTLFDINRVQDVCLHLIQDKNSVIILERQDKIIGALGATITPGTFSYDKLSTEIFWFVKPEFRSYKIASSMMGAYEYWAKMNGCRFVSLSCVDPGLKKLYNRKGFKLVETAFLKEV